MFKTSFWYIPGIIFILQTLSLSAQERLPVDTALVKKDTVHTDSLALSKKKSQPFTSPVTYVADDSVRVSMSSKKVYMYKNAKINYEKMELKSERVNFNMDKSLVDANGIKDSTGKYTGKPHMKQGTEEFDADSLQYSFKTKKGKVYQIYSNQDDGFLQAEVTQIQPNKDIHLRNGKYTTCEAEHPHFYLDLTKAISIPGKNIITGPAYLVMEDIPLPIGIPFGFFPSTHKNASGILIPTYGEETSRGFYLRNGGYYFALSKSYDLKLMGDIYSKGSWGISAASQYIRRYKYSGNFTLRYANTVTGILNDKSKTTDYSIQWSHSQASQANPYRNFSASVNMSSTKYSKTYEYTNASAYLNNQKSSSVSYSRSWPNNSPFNLSVKLGHSQNSKTEIVTMTAPSGSFNVSRIYPFRGKDGSSDKWWDDLTFSYSSTFENSISTTEDSLFTKSTLNKMKSGFKHTIPFGTTIKLWKKMSVNLSPSLNYTGVVYTKSIREKYYSTYYNSGKDTTYTDYVKVDTINGFSYAHGLAPTLSLSATPTIYGRYTFGKKSKVEAIRHVIRPSASLSFVPALNDIFPDYSKTYVDGSGKVQTYYIYNSTVNAYSPPTSTKKKSGSISLGLYNSLEMKVKSDKDTSGVKKVKLIDNLNLSTSYNIFADSMNFSTVSFNGTVTPFKEWTINISGTMDMYAYQKYIKGTSVSYARIKDFEYAKTGRLARLTSLSVSTGYKFQSGQGSGQGEDSNTGGEQNKEGNGPAPESKMEKAQQADKNIPRGEYDYFSIPWSINIDYDFTYSKPYVKSTFTQTMRCTGNFSLTPKWKINFNTGYDLKSKAFSYTTLGIDRELHCWVMSFSCSPFGSTKFYNFQINVKSAMLSDLKYDKRKSIYDY